MWRAFILGLIAAGVLAGLGGLAVVEFGLFDARASTPHSAPVAWATHTTMIHSVQRETAGMKAPASFRPDQVEAGFGFYDADCTSCHGGPAVPRAGWAAGLNPSPPYLLDAPRHWTPVQLYWIVRNGVKMTGMPAWNSVHSDAEVWDIVAFLEAMPDLSPADYQRMRAARRIVKP